MAFRRPSVRSRSAPPDNSRGQANQPDPFFILFAPGSHSVPLLLLQIAPKCSAIHAPRRGRGSHRAFRLWRFRNALETSRHGRQVLPPMLPKRRMFRFLLCGECGLPASGVSEVTFPAFANLYVPVLSARGSYCPDVHLRPP